MTTLTKMQLATFQQKTAPDLSKVRKLMMKQIETKVDQAKLNELASVLNLMLKSESFNEFQKELLKNVQMGVKSGLEDVQIATKQKLTAVSPEIATAWNDYNAKNQAYQDALNQGIIDLTTQASEVQGALTKAKTLSKKLNHTKGQVFESFLQLVIPMVNQKTVGQIDGAVQNLTNVVKSKTRDKEFIATQGAVVESIEIQIGKKTRTISSKGKVDVAFEGTGNSFISDEDQLKISAKNFSQWRDISLVSGGSAVGFISQWPVLSAANYYYNALVWNPIMFQQVVKPIFAIQALAGVGGEHRQMANVLFLNIRNLTNPIKAVSIYSILNEIQDDLDQAIKITFQNLGTSIPQIEYSEDEFYNLAKQIKINALFQSSWLKKYIKVLGQ